MLPKVKLEIYDHFAKITNFEGFREEVKFCGSDALTRALSVEMAEYTSPHLYQGTILFKDGPEKLTFIVQRHTHQYIFHHFRGFNGKRKLALHFPYILFKWELVKKDGYYSVANPIVRTAFTAPTMDTLLYIQKMPNIYNGSGRLCWGSNVDTKISSISELQQIEELYFTKEHNDDYYINTDWFEKHSIYDGVMFTNEDEWAEALTTKKKSAITLAEFANKME